MKSKGTLIGFIIADILLIGLAVYMYMQVDRTVPVISFEENDLIYSSYVETEKLLEGVTAYDSVDGDVTDSIVIEKVSLTGDGEAIVTYAAMDKANNVAKESRTFKAAKE